MSSRVRILILAALMLAFTIQAQAAPPSKCHPEMLPELVARVSLKQFSTQFTAAQIAKAVWTDIGALRQAARTKDDKAIQTFLADREGAYDWISTQAAADGIAVNLYVGRMVDCAIRTEVHKALFRDKDKGTANEFIQQANTHPDAAWLVKSLRANMNAVKESRIERDG